MQGLSSITENVAGISRRISEALLRSGDPGREVKLIAVSKTLSADRIAEAMDAGLYRFGENRVQEIVPKFEGLKGRKAEWHFIGHLQTNKVKRLLEVPTAYIHSVDRLEVGAELEKQLQKRGEARDILVEVNMSGEPSKSGVEPGRTVELLHELSQFQTLHIKGLMTIGALTDDTAVIRKCFAGLKDLFARVRGDAISNVEMLDLSMGMSADFEIAVEEGATMVRVGTAIFGEREKPDPQGTNP
ncbi:MAG: YggS family pyridoxal phosphate-dependent enzyme [Bacteroidetes bacterium]|nr:YggS family pyridoxal phosphate-dependent enzyme [Bacteroidota bacterium]